MSLIIVITLHLNIKKLLKGSIIPTGSDQLQDGAVAAVGQWGKRMLNVMLNVMLNSGVTVQETLYIVEFP